MPSLLVSLDEKNYGSRAWVVRALSAIHDPRSLDLLEYALTTDIAPSVRRSAARGLAELNLIYPEDSSKLNRCLLALLEAIKDDESDSVDGENTKTAAVKKLAPCHAFVKKFIFMSSVTFIFIQNFPY